jgi:hypothetical protein
MKEYIIWLDSGKSLTGKIDDETAEELAKCAVNLVATAKGGNVQSIRNDVNMVSFDDTDGTLYVRLDKISAIGINNITESHRAGF